MTSVKRDFLCLLHTYCIALVFGEGAVVYGSLGQKEQDRLFTEELIFKNESRRIHYINQYATCYRHTNKL